MNEYIVGLDVGSSKVYAAVAKIDKNKENLQIAGISSMKCEGLCKGIVMDIEETSNSIGKCLEQLEDLIGTKIETVNLVMPQKMCDIIESKGIVSITSPDRRISKEDMRKAERVARDINVNPDKEIIGAIPRGFIIDENKSLKNPEGYSGDKLEAEVQVIVARSSSLSNLINSIVKVGINVEVIDIQQESAAKAVLKKEEREEGVMLVDIGDQTTDICVYKNDYLCYTKNIPLGGRNITNDISIGLNLSYNKAEELKINYGTLVYSEDEVIVNSTNCIDNDIKQSTLVEIIDARVEEILDFIKEEFNNYDTLKDVKSIVIIGGGITQFRGITQKCEYILQKRTRIGIPDYMGAASPIFSNAVGILINIFDSWKQEAVVEESVNIEENEFIEENMGLAKKIKSFFAELF